MRFLYIVATPIGNLKDITVRAIETLKGVDLVLAEDTRVTAKLLNHLKIKKPIKRYDEHVHNKGIEGIVDFLENEGDIALVTDAGTPGISDPVARLVSSVSSGVKVIPIPGPSAVTSALSVSGISADKFVFLGYPPHKKKRKKFFESIKNAELGPIVLFESPHRLQKTFSDLKDVFSEDKKIFVAKEITKIYEEYFTGTIKEAIDYFINKKGKGEFVIIIDI